MSAKKNHDPLAGDLHDEEQEAEKQPGEAASVLAKENDERNHPQKQLTDQIIVAEKQYYFWRKWLLIPLMLAVPWLLFGGVIWIIFFSEPLTCPTMGMCKDPGPWTTKNIFVSGSFVTLVSFYLALTKGLFGDKAKDKSLAEKAGDTIQTTKPSNES